MSELKLVPATDRKSGRAVFDDTGRGTWEWQTSTGVFERSITDEQLHRLESPQLSLQEEAPSKAFEWVRPQGSNVKIGTKAATQVRPVARLIRRLVGRR